ncbi:MAG TPA: hypothetical protein VGJ56_00575 [Reyranella sp.]|jgi:hypothetical protein
MPITKDEVVALAVAFHDVVKTGGTAAEQARFFLHPEPRIFILHGEDVSLQANYEIHQRMTDERHLVIEPWDVTLLSESPERARAVGTIYWEGRLKDSPDGALIKCIVGEDWVVQRRPSGELKIALYVNAYHRFLPDGAPIDLK